MIISIYNTIKTIPAASHNTKIIIFILLLLYSLYLLYILHLFIMLYFILFIILYLKHIILLFVIYWACNVALLFLVFVALLLYLLFIVVSYTVVIETLKSFIYQALQGIPGPDADEPSRWGGYSPNFQKKIY
jgi:hypothetical protein